MTASSTVTLPRYGNLIGGVWSESGERREVRSPATGEAVHSVCTATVDEVDASVEAARHALDKTRWSYDPELRTRVLFRFVELLRDHAAELTDALQRESGKLYGLAKVEARNSANSVEHYAGFTRWIHGRSTAPRPDLLNIVMREPVGVVGAILPWNMPLGLLVRVLSPALAAGNAIVIKPDELTSGSTAAALELLTTIPELPPGIVSMVSGGDDLGRAITEHPDVDMVTFTGSSQTGKAVMAACAGTLKKVSLELGGKNPVIVLDDADLDRALDGVIEGAAFYNAGQICLAGSRVLIHRSLYDHFTERLADRVAELRVGNGAERGIQCGPVISEAQLERVLGYIDIGRSESALLTGGHRLSDGPLGNGYFVAPTVFRDVSPDSVIAREEIFGPVVATIPFGDIDEAVDIANGTRYGLAAAVFTGSIDRAMALARRIRAGTVWINTYGQLTQATELGGMRESGLGRQYGIEGLYEYTELKNIALGLLLDDLLPQ